MSGYRELYKKIKESSSQSLITDYIVRKGRATQNENEVCENPWPLPQTSFTETVSSDDEDAIINGETDITSSINLLLEQPNHKGKSSVLQWLPANLNIEGNECTDSLVKEDRCDDQPSTIITLADAKGVTRSRLLPHTFKKPLITDFDSPRIIASTITKLRIQHYKNIKVHPVETRSYIRCKNCPEIQQLKPKHIFEIPAFTPRTLKFGLNPFIDPLQLTHCP
ncbi:hypothetical protein TNCV_4761911 [Trichonephila clavipes]|nr:hypothetical protein TNCV_4761911 [Trichonephila clavipes]